MGKVYFPSAIAYKDIDLNWLVGRTVCGVSYEATWWFDFGSKNVIGVGCLWRIIEHERVILTSQDHGQKFGLPAPVDAVAKCTDLFSKRRVAAVHLRDATADLAIKFTDDLRLEIIPDSSGYESWQLTDPSGTSYVAQGGGQICKWKM
jgi:hypothetical protein